MAQDTKINIKQILDIYLNDAVANNSIKPSQVNEVITDVLDSYLNTTDGGNIVKAVTGTPSLVAADGVIDLSVANHFYHTLSASATFSFNTLPSNSMTFVIEITQSGAGSYTATFDNSNVTVKYVSLDIDETVGNITEFWCRYDSVNNTLFVNSVKGFTTL